jgi:5'-nucleotidase
MDKPICLIDMDAILVDMLTAWLAKYNQEAQESVLISDIKEYDMDKVCRPEILYKILEKPGFFYDMAPMPGAVDAFTQLMEEKYEIFIVTQPPRKAEFAVRDKCRWVKKHFPSFNITNMVFCHKKYLIRGDLLFDDKPAHLSTWKLYNPSGLTATLDWPYNAHCDADFHGDLNTGWREFVEFVHKRLK